MSYKCPLCLKELTEADKLMRFCFNHPQRLEQFACDSLAFNSKIFCEDSHCNEAIDEGVYLRHIGCIARNPFWNGQSGKVEVPGDARSSTVPYRLTTGNAPQDVKVLHWEIGMLRVAPQNVPEMWFPLMLLRATAETGRGKRFGVLVELAGAREAGKTVLTMQAMDKQGYVRQGMKGRDVEVKDYIFSRRPAGATDNPLLEILYLRGLMRLNHPNIFLPQGTKRETGDLKTVFLKPATTAAVGAQRDASQGRGGSFFRELKEELLGITGELIHPLHARPFWYTVAFYDTAGEAWENEDLMPDLKVVDKVAVIVNANDLFTGQNAARRSIKVANSRIGKIKDRTNSCLVVTQLDRVMSAWTKDEQDSVRRIAEDLGKSTVEEARSLLLNWLTQHPNPDNEELEKNLRRIGHVFFIWTIDLPTARQQQQVQPPAQKGKQVEAQTPWQPTSFGLAKFICWCLNISWEAINQQ